MAGLVLIHLISIILFFKIESSRNFIENNFKFEINFIENNFKFEICENIFSTNRSKNKHNRNAQKSKNLHAMFATE